MSTQVVQAQQFLIIPSSLTTIVFVLFPLRTTTGLPVHGK